MIPDLLAIAEGLDVILLSADEVLLQFGTRSRPSELLRDSDLKGYLGPVFSRLLHGPARLDELLAVVPAEDHGEVERVLEDLQVRGILCGADASPVDQYIGYSLTGKTPLASRSASVIGAGPLGARIGHSLLQHGLGKVSFLDDRHPDSVWPLFQSLGIHARDGDQREVHKLVHERLVGLGYVNASSLTGRLDSEGVEAAVAESEFVVVALERPQIALTHLVNRVCVRTLKPWMVVTIDGALGLVGPLFVPPHTACYNDFRALTDAATPSRDMLRKYYQRLRLSRGASFFTGLPSYADVVAGYAALAIAHFLLRESCFALGRVLAIDFANMQVDVEDVLKLPRCAVCGHDRPAYQPVFPGSE